jgi:AbrB family looped-hinge helix DNA binding protein
MKATSSLSHGRTVIPAALRDKLGFREGDKLIWEIRDGELVVTTRLSQLRRVQALVSEHVPGNTSLADELIADRRAEQCSEDKL